MNGEWHILSRVEMRLLGACRLRVQGGGAAWTDVSAPRQRALLGYLALHPDPVRRDLLAELLWGEKPGHQALQSMRQLLLETRKRLDRVAPDLLTASSGEVALRHDRITNDAVEFARLANAALPQHWARAAELYTGELLGDFLLGVESFDIWLRGERRRLALKAASLLQRLAQWHADEGRAADAVAMAERLVERDPGSEAAQRCLIRHLAGHLGVEAALAHGAILTRSLAHEFGAAPDAATIRLLDDLRAGSLTPAAVATLPDIRPTSPPAGERKLVTILSAALSDPADALAALDPEDAQDLVDPVLALMVAAVEQAGGTVSQVVTGGIAALFGAPVAQEDHAVRACLAALRMQADMRDHAASTRLAIRVGLASGEAVVRGVALGHVTGYTAVGAVADLAIATERAAAPGEIGITDATMTLVRGFAELRTLPETGHVLTGLDTSRSLWHGTGLRSFTPLIARDAEAVQLRAALARAQAGHGGIVAVAGEPGIGKSRLCWDFIGSAETMGWTVLQARAEPYGQIATFMPITALLRAYVRVTDHDAAGTVGPKVAARLRALDGALGPAMPALLSLLGVSVTDPAWTQLAPAQRRQQTLDGVIALFLSIARATPLLILIEDLHWIDTESQALLDHLSDRLASAPMLLLVNYRPEYHNPWAAKAHHRLLPLAALPVPAVDRMLDALLGEHGSLDQVKGALVGRTAGNPLFIEESLHALVETGALTGNPGAYRMTDPAMALPMPSTIQGILAARIDRLDPADKRLLEAASVIGKDVPRDVLCAVTALAQDSLPSRLDRLQAADLLLGTPSIERTYTFKHALTHEVAYRSMLKPRRRDLHGRAMAAIERLHAGRLDEHLETLAHHAERGELWDKAVDYLHQAGRRANQRSAFREAEWLLAQALPMLDRLPQTRATIERAIDIRVDLRSAIAPTGDQARVKQVMTDAYALAEGLADQARLARVRALLTAILSMQGDFAGSIAMAEQIADEPQFGAKSYASLWAATSMHALGQHDAAIRLFGGVAAQVSGKLTFARFDQLLLPSVFAQGGSAISLAEIGDFAAALACGARAVQVADTTKNPIDIGYAALGLGCAYLRQGRMRPAIAILDRALHACREWPLMLLAATVLLAGATVAIGRAAAAAALLQPFRQDSDKLDMRNMLAFAETVLSEAALQTGDSAGAYGHARAALVVAQAYRQSGYEAGAWKALGDVAAARPVSNFTDAKAHYDRAIAMAAACGMRPLMAHAHAGLANAMAASGDQARAQQQAAIATGLYHDMAMTFWLHDETALTPG